MLLNSKRHIDRRRISLLFNNTPCPSKLKSTIVLLYDKCVMHFLPFWIIKIIDIMDG